MSKYKITYKGGMIKKLSEKENLPEHVFDETSLPHGIIETLDETRIIDIGGTYGDPNVGNPIQYDHLYIEHEKSDTLIEVYNLSIFIMIAEDPYLHRVFKVMTQFQKLIKF